jgi:hypothetical protein
MFSKYNDGIDYITKLYKITENQIHLVDYIKRLTSGCEDRHYKPFYHVYIVLHSPNYADKPLILFSSKYKSTNLINKICDICNNTLNPILTINPNSNSKLIQTISKFKMKYGADKIPIKLIDEKFITKYKLSLNHFLQQNLI